MIFSIGVNDGFIQLRKIIKPEFLYNDTHSNAIGKVWYGAHRAVSEIIKKCSVETTSILEIGGGTGKLNAICNDMECKYSTWDIIEVQPCPVINCKARFIKGIFPDSLNKNCDYDMIIHTHCMEHMLDLHKFFKDIVKHIRVNGRMIFSIPDMLPMIKAGVTSVINFEHSFLLLEEYVDFFLKKYGFAILDKIHYGNGHSLIYSTKYTGEIIETVLHNMYYTNKTLMLNYYKMHVNIISQWNEKLKTDKRKCYLFGAHITAQFFVSFGLDINRIEAILDNDKYKIGKKVCGIDKEIYFPSIIKNQGKVIILLPNSPYLKEIKEDIITNINSDADCWVMCCDDSEETSNCDKEKV